MTGLIEIAPPRHDVIVDLVYGRDDNFTGRRIYARPRCFLHADAAACLERAIAYAAEQGLRLRIADAFRPAEAQWALWRRAPDPAYVADPRRGSPHSRGVAVDATLVDGDGRDLDMGGPVDDLTENGHHDAPGNRPGAARQPAPPAGSHDGGRFRLVRRGVVALPALPAAPLSSAHGRRGGNRHDGPTRGRAKGASDDLAGFLEREAVGARAEIRGLAVAQVEEKVGAQRRAGEKGLVDSGVVEARHRAAVEAQGAGGDDQVGALERAVAERGNVGEIFGWRCTTPRPRP